jgi:hypothetical protein
MCLASLLRISQPQPAWTPVNLWRSRAASDSATNVGGAGGAGGAGAAGQRAAHVGNALQGLMVSRVQGTC